MLLNQVKATGHQLLSWQFRMLLLAKAFDVDGSSSSVVSRLMALLVKSLVKTTQSPVYLNFLHDFKVFCFVWLTSSALVRRFIIY